MLSLKHKASWWLPRRAKRTLRPLLHLNLFRHLAECAEYFDDPSYALFTHEPRVCSSRSWETGRYNRWASGDEHVGGQQLAFNYCKLSVNHSKKIRLATTSEGKVLRCVRE